MFHSEKHRGSFYDRSHEVIMGQQLIGKVALVTGFGSGLGRAISDCEISNLKAGLLINPLFPGLGLGNGLSARNRRKS